MHFDPPQHRLRNIALMCLLALLHAMLVLFGLRPTLLKSARNDMEALQLLTLSAARTKSETAGAAQAGAVPVVASPPTDRATAPDDTLPQQRLERQATIDWTQEAQSEAQRQAELAAMPGSRPLDDRDHHGVRGGTSSRPAPEFGWDSVHAGQVQHSDGALFIRLNDRCTLVLMPLPLFGCGIGGDIKIRGDLFDHMRDVPALGAPPAAAP